MIMLDKKGKLWYNIVREKFFDSDSDTVSKVQNHNI